MINTNNLKKFAQGARKKLIEQVTAQMGVVLHTDSAKLREDASAIEQLKKEIEQTSQEQVIEKVAYTWFNRLMAIRFLDANDYQPLNILIITPREGHSLPELLDEAKQGHIDDELNVNTQKIHDLLDGKLPSNNPQNEVYKELLIGACNHLNAVFPFLFEKINDYTELLLPEDLTSDFSIIYDIREGMTVEDCSEVEIVGWLYQFYISEKKDEVFASKKKVKKEDIPAATQLFTPRWIVEYMVQNTLGKLWLQNKPNSKIKEYMPYYIDSVTNKTTDYLEVESIEDIKFLDPATGSGHILVYAFELFTKIYEEEGYSLTEIPKLILEKNLHGFEIDERAAQLADFALMMKARQYQRRVFGKGIEPNILCYEDILLTNEEIKEAFAGLKLEISAELEKDFESMLQATNLGSLIIPSSSFKERNEVMKKINDAMEQERNLFSDRQFRLLKMALNQLDKLGRKYDCVVANPPYMGGGNMNAELASFVKKNYPDSKADMMTCFMESSWNMLLPKGHLGMINLPSWLFLSSFEKLREKLIKERHIDSLLHMGRGIFGVDWGSTAFIIQNQQLDKDSKYFKLHKRNFQHLYPEDIQKIFLKAKNDSYIKINFDKYREENGISSIDELVDEKGLQISYTANQKDFEKIPGSPIGYWLSERMLQIFSEPPAIKDIAEPRAGLQTGDNEKFLRVWNEINFNLLGVGLSKVQANKSDYKWFPYNKGGAFKKWYGNREYVINWYRDGKDLREDKLYKLSIGKCLPGNSKPKNTQYYFRESLTWSFVSSGTFGVRYSPQGAVYDIAGSSVFPETDLVKYLCAFLNSKLAFEMLKVLAPTINFQVGDIKRLPIILVDNNKKETVNELADKIIQFVISEDNSREINWEFKQNELIRIKKQSVEETYSLFQQYWRTQFLQLHKNEEELNRQFIEIYGLQDELTPDVDLKDITILKEETEIIDGQLVFKAKEVMAQFVSYAVGCMFGRYSLDKKGLILANQGETLEDFLKQIPNPTFTPDDDNIIPILNDEWFEDDITGRFKEFLQVTFGKENIQKNLAFIEECLGKNIRKYFITDFYNDHIKRYKKRPIYWMFSSPNGSFNVLIYMHRYTKDTLNDILNNYLGEFQEKLKARKQHLTRLQETESGAEELKAVREIEKIEKTLVELRKYELDILYDLATENISIDLDDGVLVNYNKFGTAIKAVSGLNDQKTKKKVLEFDWIDITKIK
jgi:type II restriction/modification system DNA methylase subunit YeeA